jgi:acyl-CoA thioester hydrolase
MMEDSVVVVARGYELDSYQHVNNAVYLNYFEHARWEYFRKFDLLNELKRENLLPVVTDVHIRYQREIRLFQEIEIRSRCFIRKPYLVFQQRMINISTGLSASRATTKLLFLDRSGLPSDIPDQVLQAIDPEKLSGDE